MPETASYAIECPCTLIFQWLEACTETVTVTFEGGFASTTAKVEACSALRTSQGIVDYTVRKSTALGFRKAA